MIAQSFVHSPGVSGFREPRSRDYLSRLLTQINATVADRAQQFTLDVYDRDDWGIVKLKTRKDALKTVVRFERLFVAAAITFALIPITLIIGQSKDNLIEDIISGAIMGIIWIALALWLRYRESRTAAVILLILTGINLAILILVTGSLLISGQMGSMQTADIHTVIDVAIFCMSVIFAYAAAKAVEATFKLHGRFNVERSFLEAPGSGKLIEIPKNQIDQWIAAGKVSIICRAHVLDAHHPQGIIEEWTVGENIPQDMYERFKDEHGDIYVTISYKAGEPNKMIVEKSIWEAKKSLFRMLQKEPLL